eukprot:11861812-Ditylum_brightwellii.AAC.1
MENKAIDRIHATLTTTTTTDQAMKLKKSTIRKDKLTSYFPCQCQLQPQASSGSDVTSLMTDSINSQTTSSRDGLREKNSVGGDLESLNRLLLEENAAMKKEMREMKARLKDTEEKLRLSLPEKEQDLMDAVEALRKVVLVQEQKLRVRRKENKKSESEVSTRNELIECLQKEIEKLNSTCTAAEKECQSMHEE